MNNSAIINNLTPMMQQYFAIKSQHREYLLFYRMGDFYELFFEDAKIAANTLDITLTKRGKHMEQDIPMCGVPYHSAEIYLNRLIKAGFKVAICEQMESPEEAKKRGYKAVVKREVVRIITPGTITEENLLDSRSTNYLAAVTMDKGQYAIAWCDITSGEFFYSKSSIVAIASDLARIAPREIIISDKLLTLLPDIYAEYKQILSEQVNSFFDYRKSEHKICQFFALNEIAIFNLDGIAEIMAVGAVLEYIQLTQKSNEPRIGYPKKFEQGNFLEIDSATRRNLELSVSLRGDKKSSLLGVLDNTITSGGARLLLQYIMSPLIHPHAINARLDVVEFFYNHAQIRRKVREILLEITDLERIVGRIAIGRASPRDLAAMRFGLNHALRLSGLLEFVEESKPELLVSYMGSIAAFDDLREILNQAIRPDPGLNAKDGNFILQGFDAKLDNMRDISQNSEKLLENLRGKYRAETGIANLKIEFNNLIGYYIEITNKDASKTPDYFLHKQSMATAIRYVTEELRELEYQILNARENSIAREIDLFQEICAKLTKSAAEITTTAIAISAIDLFANLAEIAVSQGYVRPVIDDSDSFMIENGRHPVVENALSKGAFMPNGCNLGDNHRFWLITGPNMAGKSTFLRQNAIMVIMAQLGSFVAADSAHIGVVDKLFSRIGASDDLSKGKSTFMVEMSETATILHNATAKSLVILDEIGRGTSTFDGLSIALSVCEYLHNQNRSRCIFATHYHELTSLKNHLRYLGCYSMRVQEHDGEVIFHHEVIAGAADKSYGIYVAKIAGLPKSAIKRAEEVLKILEAKGNTDIFNQHEEDLPLFMMK